MKMEKARKKKLLLWLAIVMLTVWVFAFGREWLRVIEIMVLFGTLLWAIGIWINVVIVASLFVGGLLLSFVGQLQWGVALFCLSLVWEICFMFWNSPLYYKKTK